LPEDLLWVEDSESKERVQVVPGGLRGNDVKVGAHIAISPGAVPRFLKRFEEVYTISARRTQSWVRRQHIIAPYGFIHLL
jgi:hypothetical protein